MASEIKKLRELYPKGTRIKLGQMSDPYSPVPRDTLGTVEGIDDMGTIHMSWDNGQSLGLIKGEDQFRVVDRPNQLKVLIIEPKQHPRTAYINNNLEDMMNIVDGYIEEIFIDDETVLVCNEEGKIKGLEANRRIGNDIIVGTFFIARDDGSENLQSLTQGQIDKYNDRFYELEMFTQEEVQGVNFYKLLGF